MKLTLMGEFPQAALNAMYECVAQYPGLFEVDVVDTLEKQKNMYDAECVIMRILKMPREVIEQNPNLKFIQKWGAGFDTVDIEAAAEFGIPVANMPGANAFSVAEQTVMLMLATLRDLAFHYEALKRGEWTKSVHSDRTYSLLGKTVGLIGCGNIGREVTRRVQAFGARVIYYDPRRLNAFEEQEMGVEYVPFDQLIENADIISMHVPLNEHTHHMISADVIAKMKPTAIVINAARGGVVDEMALAAALSEGRILGAGLDAFSQEPPPADHPLLNAPNVIYTPHTGGVSVDLAKVMGPLAINNCAKFAQTGEADFVVNKHLMK